MAIIPHLLRLTAFKSPFLRTLVPSIGLAYVLQGAVGLPSILGQTERFYDLSGSLTYLSCTALSLYLPTIRARYAAEVAGTVKPAWPTVLQALRNATSAAGAAGGWNWRMVVLSVAVTLWAARLGSFLFMRIMSDGEDSRFEKIRSSPPKFAVAFFAQATWVSLCLLPVLAVNSIPATTLSSGLAAFTITDAVGLALYIGGFAFEAVADRQKSKWSQEKKEKKHSEQFLTRGLWSKSRHPNYFGEITLWTGIATVAGGVLCSGAGQAAIGLSGGLGGLLVGGAMAAVSPGFVSFLLTQVSGIPMSEKKYDERFKDNKDYQKWKQETPMLFPKF